MLKINVELLPPNPKELLKTCSIALLVRHSAEGLNESSDIGVLKFKLAGINWCCNAKIEITDSIPPEALVVCPVADLVELTQGIESPKSLAMAIPSEASLFIVPVPCALCNQYHQVVIHSC